MADDDGVDTKSMSQQSVCRGAMAPRGQNSSAWARPQAQASSGTVMNELITVS
jgi:hypothetical protein